MNILLLGGTGFVGRHIAETLLHAGHSLTLFNRGRTADDLPAHVERLLGDRDRGPAGIAALSGRSWDVCVDVCGYTAAHVRSSTELLRGRVERYVFISAVSVYGDPSRGPVDETCPRSPSAGEHVTEITAETYGPLKVLCENIVQDVFDGRCTLLRPQVVAGPHDPFDRFSYWVRRTTEGGEMLAPGDGTDYMQVIDAGDVARFTQTVCENGLNGAFNLSGRRLTWADFMRLLGAHDIVWIPKEIIAAAGATEFMLPLYRPLGRPRSSLMHVSNARALAAGLTLTDPAVTIANVRNWLRDGGAPAESPALSPEREREMIRMFHSR